METTAHKQRKGVFTGKEPHLASAEQADAEQVRALDSFLGGESHSESRSRSPLGAAAGEDEASHFGQPLFGGMSRL